jgi:hypothetical protein
MTALERFLEGPYHVVLGQHEPWGEFHRAFMESLTPGRRPYWDEKRLRAELTLMGCPVGRGPGNRKIVGNVSKHTLPRRWVLVARNVVRLETRERNPRAAQNQGPRNQDARIMEGAHAG